MDSRKARALGQIPLVAFVLGAGCQPEVELDFVRPSLSMVQPVAALTRRGEAGARLQVALLGSPSWWGLSPQDRIRVGSRVFRLNDLKSNDFTVSTPGQRTQVRGLTHRPWSPRLSLGIVVDNSESAGLSDPAGERFVLLSRLASALESMLGQGLLRSVDLSLLWLQGGSVSVAAKNQGPAALVGLTGPPPAGRADLFDGVLRASQLLETGSQQALVLYWSSSGDSGSTATEDQALALARGVPVLAVQGPGADGLALRLAEAGGGLVLGAPVPAAIADAASVLTARTRGVWELDLATGAPLDGASELDGEVALSLSPDGAWSRAFRLPLFRSPGGQP